MGSKIAVYVSFHTPLLRYRHNLGKASELLTRTQRTNHLQLQMRSQSERGIFITGSTSGLKRLNKNFVQYWLHLPLERPALDI
jgi:hypothetical protein